MLRRLPEGEKHHALQLLTGTTDTDDFLYGLPHRDNSKGEHIGWPTKRAIDLCKANG
jgi:hypothetical protein